MELTIAQTVILYFFFFTIEVAITYLIQKCINAGKECRSYHRRFTISIKWKLLILEAVFILLYVVIYACRNYKVGTDTEAYYQMYKYIIRNDSFLFIATLHGVEFAYELMYTLVVHLSNVLFDSFQGFLGMMAIIQLFFFRSFSKYSIKEYNIKLYDITLLYFMLLFAPSFNIMRQTLAVCIAFWSLKYLYLRNLKLYAISIFIASLFHISAIFTILFYFLYDTKETNSRIKEKAVIVGCVLSPLLFSWMMNLISMIPFAQKYYGLYSATNISVGATHFAILNITLRAPIVLLLVFYHNALVQRNRKNRFLFVIYVFQVSCFFLSVWQHWAFRMAYYGMFADFLLVPQLFDIQKGRKQAYRALISFFYILFFFLTTVQRKYDGIVPYIFN